MRDITWHKIIIGDAWNMEEIEDRIVYLMITSPPYFNAPFDYEGFFYDYVEFLEVT